MQQYLTKNLIEKNLDCLKICYQDNTEKMAKIERAKKLIPKQEKREDKNFVYSLLIGDLNNKNND